MFDGGPALKVDLLTALDNLTPTKAKGSYLQSLGISNLQISIIGKKTKLDVGPFLNTNNGTK